MIIGTLPVRMINKIRFQTTAAGSTNARRVLPVEIESTWTLLEWFCSLNGHVPLDG